jgi:heme exporter protein D
MQWGSASEFFAMGGYGLYVWVSFGVTALCMVGEALAVWRRHAAAVAGSREGSLGG